MKTIIAAVFVAWLCMPAAETVNITTVNMTTVAPTTILPTTILPTTKMTSTMTTTFMTTVNGTDNTTTTNVTTPTPVTKISPTTSAPGVGVWTVLDAKNQTCMKMKFQGFIDNAVMKHVDIPTTADSKPSTCTISQDMADFVLDFTFDDTDYIVKMMFKLQDHATVFMWNASVSYISRTNSDKDSEVQHRFETPIGKSFDCNKQKISVGSKFNLTFNEMRLQPFATYAKNDYGDPYSCVAPSSPNAALIVGLTLGAVIVILLVAIFVLYRKGSKSDGSGYNNF